MLKNTNSSYQLLSIFLMQATLLMKHCVQCHIQKRMFSSYALPSRVPFRLKTLDHGYIQYICWINFSYLTDIVIQLVNCGIYCPVGTWGKETLSTGTNYTAGYKDGLPWWRENNLYTKALCNDASSVPAGGCICYMTCT